MKYIRKKFLLFIIATIILFSGNVLADEESKDLGKSAEFEKWENLSDEERKTAIQPSYNDLTIEDSLKRSTYNQLKSLGDSALADRYVLNNIIVKNQQQTNLCWAFSFTSSLESTISKKYNKTSFEYSPLYTDYVVSRNFEKVIGDGANSDISLASAISGNGAAYETDMPFETYYNEQSNSEDTYYLSYNSVDLSTIQPKVKINDTVKFANIYKSYSTDENGTVTVTYKDSSSIIGANKYTRRRS